MMGGEHSSKELFEQRINNYSEHLHVSPPQPINFNLLGRKGNTLKLERTAKLNDKQTSILTVRDIQ